ncbi:MAG: alpha/beta fold hydrolase [Alphaproteobacteria bacterium]|nr:alpha/beta fold hydrolase [Alphaproteobacteria bacterium]
MCAPPPHVAARHHPLAIEHVDAPHRWHAVGDFALESGETIRDCGISWVEHGIDDPSGARTIVGFTAIGATHHRLDFLIGPGRALDTRRYRIIVIDALGNGLSTSPSNSRHHPGPAFPRIAIRDMIAAQHLLLTGVLGLARVHAVIGASMGGMQALQWAVSHPGVADRVVAMTPMARTTPWSRAINEAARRALTGDPAFAGGHYAGQPARGWRDWAVVMRVIAARTPAALEEVRDFDAWLAPLVDGILAIGVDANDYIAQSRAYDAHDVGTTPGFRGDTRAALASIAAPVLVAAPPLDLYNPSEAAQAAAAAIPRGRFIEIPSILGHHAATAMDSHAAAFLDDRIGRFLAE